MEPRTRGRPRRTETDEQIVRATQELIREHGPESVNVAAVSSRSGVARTTIYRRYQDRQALLTAALQPVTEHNSPPEGLSVHQKFDWVLARAEDLLGKEVGPGGVASVIANTDPEFSSTLRRSLESGLEPLLDHIASDVAAGELVADVDPDLLLNLIIGSYLAETLRRGTPGTGWRKQTAALLSRLLAASG